VNDFFTTIVAVPAGAAATATALGILFRLPPIQWLWRTLVSQPLAIWFQSEVQDDAAEIIKKELTNNGGESLKDAVQRIDRSMLKLHDYRREDMIMRDDRQHEVDRELAAITGRVDQLVGSVVELIERMDRLSDMVDPDTNGTADPPPVTH
jgi:hypothetical protein